MCVATSVKDNAQYVCLPGITIKLSEMFLSGLATPGRECGMTGEDFLVPAPARPYAILEAIPELGYFFKREAPVG